MNNQHSKRRALLLVLTSLVVSYIRTYIQYHHFWKSIGQFFISWFINYIALVLVVAIAGYCIESVQKFFLGDNSQRKRFTFEEASVYVSIVVLVLSAFIFILMHWIPAEDVFEK
jgi:hypothetical protein